MAESINGYRARAKSVGRADYNGGRCRRARGQRAPGSGYTRKVRERGATWLALVFVLGCLAFQSPPLRGTWCDDVDGGRDGEPARLTGLAGQRHPDAGAPNAGARIDRC